MDSSYYNHNDNTSQTLDTTTGGSTTSLHAELSPSQELPQRMPPVDEAFQSPTYSSDQSSYPPRQQQLTKTQLDQLVLSPLADQQVSSSLNEMENGMIAATENKKHDLNDVREAATEEDGKEQEDNVTSQIDHEAVEDVLKESEIVQTTSLSDYDATSSTTKVDKEKEDGQTEPEPPQSQPQPRRLSRELHARQTIERARARMQEKRNSYLQEKHNASITKLQLEDLTKSPTIDENKPSISSEAVLLRSPIKRIGFDGTVIDL